MKTIVSLLLLTAMTIAPAVWAKEAHQGHHEEPQVAQHESHQAAQTGNLTITGEILDMACYMAHEGKGPKHKKCAQECILGGAPMGILTDTGEVYLLVNDHNNEKPYKDAKGYAGARLKVTGKVHKRGGVQAIVISSFEKA